MKRLELFLGGVLVAALVVGYVLTRESGVEDDDRPVALDLSSRDGTFDVEGISVEVSAEPRPLRVFDPLHFTLRFERAGEPVEVGEARLDFNMTMDMGPHVYRLVRDEEGDWIADDVVLPQCGSGSRLWFADLTFEEEGRQLAARLRLELEPPRAD